MAQNCSSDEGLVGFDSKFMNIFINDLIWLIKIGFLGCMLLRFPKVIVDVSTAFKFYGKDNTNLKTRLKELFKLTNIEMQNSQQWQTLSTKCIG